MGELMNLYWSGAAEEKNSALQGNLMLQSADFQHFLSNGIAVKIVSRGAISFDLSGQVSSKCLFNYLFWIMHPTIYLVGCLILYYI